MTDFLLVRSARVCYTHVGTQSIYALNTLNKVTDALLPSEMPPAPQNREENIKIILLTQR